MTLVLEILNSIKVKLTFLIVQYTNLEILFSFLFLVFRNLMGS